MSERLDCAECGAPFYSVTAAWGDRTCGECIAGRVALALWPAALRAERRPMRRAAAADSVGLHAPAERALRKTG